MHCYLRTDATYTEQPTLPDQIQIASYGAVIPSKLAYRLERLEITAGLITSKCFPAKCHPANLKYENNMCRAW